ncbi:hypothetical protein NBRC10512_001948 [Rhodotorula toruloides]|uniref:RHTO0S03e11716g1_1 n=2 Tax=Rhodotorula toruloides TaxID=5286 RepID=A0A061AV80_RHOTO|nr:uncharacterized protein RHTO_00552 [Rhodotorula toruloides NP11]EMS26124.1 hypothetical protein RHTO_00552 [Rhodotorula toruloides NP11]CDR38645.1 RHTO0S03e11716g1_1 [Rhodotorula toruloides]
MGVLGSFADTDSYQYWLPDSTWHRFMSSTPPAGPAREGEGGEKPHPTTMTASLAVRNVPKPQDEQEQHRQDESVAHRRRRTRSPSPLPYLPHFRPSDAAERLVKCIRDLSSSPMAHGDSGDLRLSLQTYSDIIDRLNGLLADITPVPRPIAYERTTTPLYSPASSTDSPRDPVFEGARDRQIVPAPLKSSCMVRLPAEILLSIFLLARDMHMAEETEPVSQDERFQPPKTTRSYAFSTDAKGAFYFSLGLANVCRSWRTPAIAAALRSIVLPSGAALRDVMTLLPTSSFKSAYASQIAELKVLVITGLDAPAYNRYDDVRMPGAPVENGKQVDALPVCAHILSMLPNLQKLEIALFPARAKINLFHGNYPYRNAQDYLAPALFSALTGLSQLTSLTFSCGIDFEDLEAIFLNLPLLRRFAAQAISDFSETGAISSSVDHSATRLASFRVGRDRPNSGSDVQPAQLAWLLRPPCSARSLRELELHVYVLDGNQVAGPSFASSEVEALLQLNGSATEVLILNDTAETGRASPLSAHSFSDFDATFAIISALRTLSIDWCYTGPTFISTVSSLAHLQHLEMSGAPHSTPAATFLWALKHSFPALKRLNLSGDVTGSSAGLWSRPRAPARGRTDWTGSTIRTIQAICDERGIEYSLKDRALYY